MDRWEPPAFPDGSSRLDDRVIEFLTKRSGTIAFNGLRRALGVHPESLTRSLRRLERLGAVNRGSGGYSLTVPGPDPGPAPETLSSRNIATLQVPPGVDRDALFAVLAGRWAGPLRWVGVYDRPGDPWLAWSLDGTPGHVLLSVKKGSLRVMVDLPRGAPDGERLEAAADDLLLRVLDRLRSLRPEDSSTPAFERSDPSVGLARLWSPRIEWAPEVDMAGPLEPFAS